MKRLLLAIGILVFSIPSLAEVRCKDGKDQIVVRPQNKKVEVLRDGQLHQLKIVSRNHHAYRMFGESTFEVEGGIILGVQSNNRDKKKDLTVFRNGSPISTYRNCSI